jgi:predicted ribosomally synthesized peptide with SipW-like signal peptide
MSRKHVKQYLMLLLAVGVIAVSLSGGGTFATFNAEVANPNNTFVTGTLYLHQTKSGTCTSESAQSNSNLNNNSAGGVHLGDACDILFSGVSSTGYQQIGLDMKDAGTLDGDGLRISLGNTSNGFAQTGCVSTVDYEQVGTVAATAGFTTISPGGLQNSVAQNDTISSIHLTSALGISLYNGAQIELQNGTSQTQLFTTTAIVSPTATTIPVTNPTTITPSGGFTGGDAIKYSPQFSGGGGNLCSELKLQMVEVGSASNYSDVTFASSTGTSTSADPDSTCVFGTPTGTGCSDGVTLSTLSNYPTFTNGTLTLTDLSASLGAPWDGGSPRDPSPNGVGMDAGTHRYLVLILYVDPSADNSVQGLKATFDVVWHMNQFTT